MTTDNEKNIFEQKLVKDGWVLNIVKQSENILSTSLYSSGKFVESKVFLSQYASDIKLFREYVKLFDDPEKNYRIMSMIIPNQDIFN